MSGHLRNLPRIWRRLADVPADFGPCATTIGNFDGVHLGHQALDAQIALLSGERGWKPAVDSRSTRIPLKLSRRTGRQDYHDSRPTRGGHGQPGHTGSPDAALHPEVSRWTPEEFVKTVLVEAMQVRAVLVGEDFRFGHKQAGDTDLLTKLGRKIRFRS